MKKTKAITKPGLYRGLSYSEYDAIEAVRSTYLKKLLHCPAMALEPNEETAALVFGNAAHCFILEGEEEYNKRYAILPKFDGDKRTKEYKAIKESTLQLASIKEQIVLDHEDDEIIRLMHKNIMAHPTAKLFFQKKHDPELVIVWKDKATGLLMKCRLDVAPYADMKVIVDLKTTVDTSEWGFRNQIEKYHYDMSAAFYLEGANAVLKEKIDLFVFLAPEKHKPCRVHVHELSPQYIEDGSVKMHKALAKEVECRKSGIFEPWTIAGAIVQEPPKRKELL